MDKIKKNLLWIITLVLCVLLFLERLTGGIWHAVFGLLLIILMAVHIGRHIRTMKYRKTGIKVVDYVLMAALVILLVTGVLSHPLNGVLVIKILHKLSAVIFVIGIIAHMVQHRSVRKK